MTEKQSTKQIPKYRHHKASGQAYVELNKRRFYCGVHGSPDSWERYHELVNQWLVNDRRPVVTDAERHDATIAELLDAFRQHAEEYYKGNSGAIHGFKAVSRVLRDLYGGTAVREFTPRYAKLVQKAMVRKGWCRSHINKSFSRLKHIFKWGTAEGMVPPDVYHGLTAVSGLRRGRCEARESEKVKPVPEQHIEAVKRRVNRQIAALIDLQLLTGARAGELVTMRPIDLDTSGNVWVFIPEDHKTAHHGHERHIYIGPKAKKIIKPFLNRPVESYLFSPAEADAEYREKRRQERKTPDSCGNRPGTNRVRKPKKRPGERYATDSYRRAIYRACDAAGVPQWSPHQLRHNAATNLRREHGIEAARVILGHRSAAITDVYAELDSARAIDVIGKVG